MPAQSESDMNKYVKNFCKVGSVIMDLFVRWKEACASFTTNCYMDGNQKQ